MTTRLQKLTLGDFTGGLNVRQNAFQVGDTETPDMLNVSVDARGGIVTRSGFTRWNGPNIDNPATWDPRHGEPHTYSNGTYAVYIASNNTVYRGDSSAVFTDTTISCDAGPHQADFAAWGDDMYIACGAGLSSYKHDSIGEQQIPKVGNGSWNNDYTTPLGGYMPSADLVEAHAGYLFVASVDENYDGAGARAYPNRLRWSHPNSPEDWAQLDYLDILTGGGRITALKSFQDHLLIFKGSSVWALFGYDSESWQLVQVSDETGTVSPASVTTSESSCFFYSASGRGGVFAMSGGRSPILISDPLRLVIADIEKDENVWLNWVSQRLFCSLPWLPARAAGTVGGIASETQTTTFIFDMTIREGGAWEAYRPARGSLGIVMERPGDREPLAALTGDPAEACVLRLGVPNEASDVISESGELEAFLSYYTTNWKDGGMEELRKHWLRPRFIIRNPGQAVTLRVDAYRNYDNTSPYRSWTVGVASSGQTFWRDLGAADPRGDGFDWDDGSLWEGGVSGSAIVRGKALGIGRSLRLAITSIPEDRNKSWGIDAITLKYNERRFTT